MNTFNYINTLKRKRNEQFSNNKNSIKKLCECEDSIPSSLGARQARYALLCIAIPCLLDQRRK